MTGAGKGDRPRRVDKKKYDANYERIFGKKTKDTIQEPLPQGERIAQSSDFDPDREHKALQ